MRLVQRHRWHQEISFYCIGIISTPCKPITRGLIYSRKHYETLLQSITSLLVQCLSFKVRISYLYFHMQRNSEYSTYSTLHNDRNNLFLAAFGWLYYIQRLVLPGGKAQVLLMTLMTALFHVTRKLHRAPLTPCAFSAVTCQKANSLKRSILSPM